MPHVTIVSGSPVKSSRLHGLTSYVQAELEKRGATVDALYAADMPAEDLLRANFASEAVQDAVGRVARADAVVLASPVYKAAYTGALKALLDVLPQKGLQHKITLPLFIGGTIAHLLSIDYALKPVVSALGGTHILTGVYAVDQWVTRLEDGGFGLSDELRERLDDAVGQLVRELERAAAT